MSIFRTSGNYFAQSFTHATGLLACDKDPTSLAQQYSKATSKARQAQITPSAGIAEGLALRNPCPGKFTQ
jgi:hypothetical protein